MFENWDTTCFPQGNYSVLPPNPQQTQQVWYNASGKAILRKSYPNCINFCVSFSHSIPKREMETSPRSQSQKPKCLAATSELAVPKKKPTISAFLEHLQLKAIIFFLLYWQPNKRYYPVNCPTNASHEFSSYRYWGKEESS